MRSTNPIAALFGKSPFRPLQQHMRVVTECVALVPGLFQAVLDDDQDALTEHKARIFVKEREADVLRNDICDHLPRSLMLAVDRQDLLGLLAMQDAIADTAQDIAGLVVSRRMDVPVGMGEPLMRLVTRCVDTCEQAHKLIEELDDLLARGLHGRDAQRVQEMAVELGRMESDTDIMAMDLTRALFTAEDTLKPISVVFWYQLIQWVGNLADHAEKVGETLRLLIARR